MGRGIPVAEARGMTNTFKFLAITSLFLGWSFASGVARAMPKEGTNELRMESSYPVPMFSGTGLSHLSTTTSGKTTSQTFFGFGLGYGRFLADFLEAGASLKLLYLGDLSSSSSSSAWSPGVGPFVRGFFLVADRIAMFGEGSFACQFLIPSKGSNATFLIPGVDLGVELFLADSWSLRIGPMYRYIYEREAVSNTTLTSSSHEIGLNWTIAGYF